jgi:chitosanase
VTISRRAVVIGVSVTIAVAITAVTIVALRSNEEAASNGESESLLSAGRPAASSSVENSTLGPAQAFDGNMSSRWGSFEGTDPQWIQVDLGDTRTVTHAVLNWEYAYGKAYEIQTSADGQSWTTIYATTAGDGGTDDLTGLNGTGRYVRLYGTVRATPWGYSLWEFKVYGRSTPGTGQSSTATGTATVPG